MCCTESRDRSTTYRATKNTLKTTILLHSYIFQLAEGLCLPTEQAIIAFASSELESRKRAAKCGDIRDPRSGRDSDEERTGSGRTAMARSAWGKGEGSVPGDKYMHQADAGEERPSRAPRPCAPALTAPGHPVPPTLPVPPLHFPGPILPVAPRHLPPAEHLRKPATPASPTALRHPPHPPPRHQAVPLLASPRFPTNRRRRPSGRAPSA